MVFIKGITIFYEGDYGAVVQSFLCDSANQMNYFLLSKARYIFTSLD